MMLGMRSRLLGGVSPAYLADFLLGTTSGVLPSGVSVSSPSLGGLVTDASGKLTYKPNNLLVQSNTFTDASWSPLATSIAGGYGDPYGGTSASKLTGNGTTTWHAIRQGATSLSPGVNTLFSVVAKAAEVSTISLSDNPGNTGAVFDLAAGTTAGVTGSDAGLSVSSPKISALGGGWYRVSVVMNASVTGRIPFIYLNGYSGGTSVAVGSGLYIYGATLSAVTYETTPRAADQVITGAQAYYGPAWDYDPVNVGTPLGLRIWESRTNLATYSDQFDNVAWTKGGSFLSAPVVTVNAATSPDGTSNADQIDFPSSVGGSGYTAVYRNMGGQSGSQTFSIYLRGASGGEKIYLSWNNGGSALFARTLATLTTAWQRFTVSYTGDATSNFFVIGVDLRDASQIGQSAATVFAYGAQAELGSTASPYTPTGASAVTAAADVVTLGGVPLALMQGAAFSYIEEFQNTPASSPLFSTAPVSPGKFIAQFSDSTSWYASGQGIGTYTPNTIRRSAVAWSGGTVAAVLAGGTVFDGAGDFTNSGVTSVTLGNYASQYQNGYVRKLALYSTKLPDLALQAKTTQGATL